MADPIAPQIRIAQLDDLEDLIAFDHIARSSASRTAFIKNSIDAQECHIALLKNDPAGYLILNHAFFEQTFIALLYIAEPHRRRGIGKALLQYAEQISRAPKLFTSTNASNKPMQNLLLKQGFKPSGTIENLDENDPELIFCKPLRNAGDCKCAKLTVENHSAFHKSSQMNKRG